MPLSPVNLTKKNKKGNNLHCPRPPERRRCAAHRHMAFDASQWCSQAESRSTNSCYYEHTILYLTANLWPCLNMHKGIVYRWCTGKDEWNRQTHVKKQNFQKRLNFKRMNRKENTIEVGYVMSSICIKMLLINHDFIISFAFSRMIFSWFSFSNMLGVWAHTVLSSAQAKTRTYKPMHEITKLLCHFKEKVKRENYDEEHSLTRISRHTSYMS